MYLSGISRELRDQKKCVKDGAWKRQGMPLHRGFPRVTADKNEKSNKEKGGGERKRTCLPVTMSEENRKVTKVKYRDLERKVYGVSRAQSQLKTVPKKERGKG